MEKGSHDQSGSLRGGMIFVLVKAIVFTIAFLFVSVFVFGMLRCPDDSMSPSLQGGDLKAEYMKRRFLQRKESVFRSGSSVATSSFWRTSVKIPWTAEFMEW